MTTIIIPARTNSDRVHRKLLQIAGGKPVIQHTWENAVKADCGQVVIATDTDELADIAHKFGAEVILTSDKCKNGTERVTEAARILGLGNYEPIVNLQGDHPMTPPEVVREMARLMSDTPGSQKVWELFCFHEDAPRMMDPSDVKVILDHEDYALFFTRQPVPGSKRHCGIYGYHLSLLERYIERRKSRLENAEHLEQMRFLEYGFKARCPRSPRATGIAINTHADLERFRQLFVDYTPFSDGVN